MNIFLLLLIASPFFFSLFKKQSTATLIDIGDQNDFLRLMAPLEDVAVKRGYKRGIITAHVALETGNGKLIIDHNLFNIKATGKWLLPGKFVDQLTTEFENGRTKPRKLPQPFRKYGSYRESLDDYLRLISTFSGYRDAWENRDNPYLYFVGLMNEGIRKDYATDPDYVDKLRERLNYYSVFV